MTMMMMTTIWMMAKRFRMIRIGKRSRSDSCIWSQLTAVQKLVGLETAVLYIIGIPLYNVQVAVS